MTMTSQHPLAAVSCLFAAILSAPAIWAYDLQDDASQSVYDDGIQAGDNGNTGTSSFDPWSFDFGSLVNVGPSTSGELDTGGRAWSAGGQEFDVVRSFPASLTAGTVVQIEMEYTSGSIASVSIMQPASLGSQVYAVNGMTNYILNDGTNSSEDTGIPLTTPVRIQWTLGVGQAYGIRIQPLPGGAPFVDNSRLYSGATTTGGLDNLLLFAYTSPNAYWNNLVIDPTGTLPAELESFNVE